MYICVWVRQGDREGGEERANIDFLCAVIGDCDRSGHHEVLDHTYTNERTPFAGSGQAPWRVC